MLNGKKLERLLFFDVETVSTEKSYADLKPSLQKLWQHKHQFLRNTEEDAFEDSYKSNAAIYAEFGKIVCISCGFLVGDQLRIKSFYGKNENELLENFSSLLETANYILCGHNIKEFDVPYICRRMLINGVKLPKTLNIASKKPWEVDFVDTLSLWKFGDYKSYTSLNLLATIFDIPTPKDDIDGSRVGTVFWEEDDLDRIVTYCQKDVVTVCRLLQRWEGLELIKEDALEIVK